MHGPLVLIGEAGERTQLDPHSRDGGPHLWSTQYVEFLQTLEPIHGIEVAALRWVASQLRIARWQSLQDVNQSVDADHIRQGSAFGSLPIEATPIADPRGAMSERNPKPLRHLDEDGADRFSQMDVLVGIQVTGTMTHKLVEQIQLA